MNNDNIQSVLNKFSSLTEQERVVALAEIQENYCAECGKYTQCDCPQCRCEHYRARLRKAGIAAMVDLIGYDYVI